MNDPLLISDFFPQGSRLLLTGGGRAFVEQLGVEAIKRATLAILSGDNIRTQTEPLTRRRIAMVSAAMVQLFAQGWQQFPDFKDELSQLAIAQLKAKRAGKTGKWIGQWLLGLTDKQYQNVLRGNSENLTQYVVAFEQTMREAASRCYLDFGAVPLGAFQLPGEQEISLDWLDILQML
nr:hypothetical protein [Tanacetum cinerariifolium]